MKKEYLKPEIEISVFATEDVITASTGDDSTTSTSGLTLGSALGDNTTGAVEYNDIF